LNNLLQRQAGLGATTELVGENIHFLHVRSPEPDAVPLILTHGWPSSIVEYLDVTGPLNQPRAHGGTATQAFHLIIPSLPGYGLSGPTRQAGWGSRRVAEAWAELMKRLGYSRYGAGILRSIRQFADRNPATPRPTAPSGPRAPRACVDLPLCPRERRPPPRGGRKSPR